MIEQVITAAMIEEAVKAELVDADNYVEAWEKKERPVYSIEQTIDSNVYAESFIVHDKAPEKKQAGKLYVHILTHSCTYTLSHKKLKNLRFKLK